MTTMTKERPILFTPAMAQAIYECRKTQTRRVVKGVPEYVQSIEWHDPCGLGGSWWDCDKDGFSDKATLRGQCPYGAPGDRLWVRESVWQSKTYPTSLTGDSEPVSYWGQLVHYAGAGDPPNTPNTYYPTGLRNGAFAAPYPYASWHRRPNIHMPRWACRSVLEIISVRVERVQDISEADARAEGFDWARADGDCEPDEDYRQVGYPREGSFARQNFLNTFYRINKRAPEGSNPWIWVIEFKKV